jgi:hypothetical protein
VRSWLLGAVLVACAAGAGCDSLFGIASIPPNQPADARTAADDLGKVQGQYLQLWAENDALGMATEMQREFPANQLTAIATLDDGSPRAVTIDDTGFSFTTPQMGDHYSLQFAAPSQVRTFDLSATALVLVERTTKRPSDTAAPPNTVLALNINGRHFENSAKEEVVTTGTWSRHQVGPSDPIQVDCAKPDPTTGAVIDMLSPHDAAYYTSTQPASGGYVHLVYYAQIHDVTTVAGMTATVPTLPIAPQAVSATSCTIVATHASDEAQRELTAVGGGTTIVGWAVGANPGLQTALFTELPLANGIGESQVPAMYGNPYGLTHIDVVAASSASNGQGATSTVSSIALAHDCSSATDIPAGQIALVSNVSLGGVALATSGQLVTLPVSSTIDIAFDVSADGDANYFTVELDQFVGASFTAVDEIVTTDHVVHVPATHLLTTSSYMIRVSASLGYPHVAEADFLTATEDAALSLYTTPKFRPQQ